MNQNWIISLWNKQHCQTNSVQTLCKFDQSPSVRWLYVLSVFAINFNAIFVNWATKKNFLHSHNTGCLTGILIMAHYNPYILVVFHPLSTRFISLLNWKPEARHRSTRTVIHPQAFQLTFKDSDLARVGSSYDTKPKFMHYCWWKKSCITWNVLKPCKSWENNDLSAG